MLPIDWRKCSRTVRLKTYGGLKFRGALRTGASRTMAERYWTMKKMTMMLGEYSPSGASVKGGSMPSTLAVVAFDARGVAGDGVDSGMVVCKKPAIA